MKKILFALLCGMLLLPSCKTDKPTQVFFSDQAGLLTDADKARISHYFDSCVNSDVHLIILPETADYAEASDRADVSFLKKYKATYITYDVAHNWIFITPQADFKNTYESRYAVAVYNLQKSALSNSNDVENICAVMSPIAELLVNKPNFLVQTASSITSVIDFFNEALIRPSNGLFHLVFFRVPLLCAALLVRMCGSLGWAIFIAILLSFACAYGREITDKHIFLFQLLYASQFMTLVCLIFFAMPSFDTILCLQTIGLNQTSAILDGIYTNSTNTVSTTFGAILFIVLYITHASLQLHFKCKGKSAKQREEIVEDTSEKTSNKADQIIGMCVLAFLLPQMIVWAVCAYLLQQIVCSDIMQMNRTSRGRLIDSVEEFRVLAYGLAAYVLLMVLWCYFPPLATWEAQLYDVLENHGAIRTIIGIVQVSLSALAAIIIAESDSLMDSMGLKYKYTFPSLTDRDFWEMTLKGFGWFVLVCLIATLCLPGIVLIDKNTFLYTLIQ